MPEALRRWFYPADSFGHEFVYKKLPPEMAETFTVPILEKPIEIGEEPKVEALVATPPKPALLPIPEPIMTPTQGDADRMIPEPVTTPMPELPVTELPKTASPVPLLALLGLLSLGGARLLRISR
jgi:hypothetical protein